MLGKLKHIVCLCVCAFLMTACGAVASTSGGLADEAYVVLSSTGTYAGSSVDLYLDNQDAIPVKVSRDGNMAVRKGLRVAVKPGKHRVVVRDRRGGLLFDRQIFVSTQNTKTIVLP